MSQEELQQTFIEGNILGANYCTTSDAKGGVCTYVHNSLNFENINLEIYCMEKDFEVCALNLKLHCIQACIITIYRAPTGSFNLFINELDTLLRKIYRIHHLR
jgi:hypothetical protein